ncbi:hypothetical protein PV326_004339 [Microctonus aethiopoides]|nr:hypothetical protein PV326_004339 [Microctonus aethiopoides]
MTTYATKKYTVAQFNNRLKVVPTCWINNVKDRVFWPRHIESVNILEKLIEAAVFPEDYKNWDLYKVERCFGFTDDWSMAQEVTRYIERDELSNDDTSAPPPCYSSTPRTSIQAIQDEENIHPSTSQHSQFHGKSITHGSTRRNVTSASTGGDIGADPDISESDFRRYVMKTVRSLSMEVKDLNKKIDQLTAAKSVSVERRDNRETSEHGFQKFPIQSRSRLLAFERELKDQFFFDEMIRYLLEVNVDSRRLGMSVSAVCSRLIADTVVSEFSWRGRSMNRCFSQLRVARLLQKALRVIGEKIWFPKEIDDAIAKWLSQAKARNRDKNLGSGDFGWNREKYRSKEYNSCTAEKWKGTEKSNRNKA